MISGEDMMDQDLHTAVSWQGLKHDKWRKYDGPRPTHSCVLAGIET